MTFYRFFMIFALIMTAVTAGLIIFGDAQLRPWAIITAFMAALSYFAGLDEL